MTRVLCILLASGCGRYWVCEAVDPDLPPRLSDTGLYADLATETLADGVVAYTPQFPLWSDGADKRRWIALPPGTQIDTADMDDWAFPDGTKLWKEFSAGGVRIETRLLEKRGDWRALSYVWSADEQDAFAAPLGEIDARRTGHDVPAAGECIACHGGRRSFVLGFSAIQLAPPELAAFADRLTVSPPAIAVPGTDVERAALGYLHANCGHCHNQRRPDHDGPRCFDPENDYDFTLAVGALATPADTATYRTAIGTAVTPGAPDDSELIARVNRRGFLRQMPPLATSDVDREGVAMLRTWIAELQP